mmetsp:Transcript_24955/g.82239  ORF Transcript_24955/g.82239 Transcript_24955/m.82239 type:complete len:132 (+) Transcript_24955:385-780(+)
MYGNGNGIDSVNPSERAHGMPADFLKPLVEVKGMFDSKGYFDLYSRAVTAVNGNGVQSPQTAQAATKAIGLPTPGEFGIDVEPYDKGESDLVDKVMLLSDKAKLELLSDIDARLQAVEAGGVSAGCNCTIS